MIQFNDYNFKYKLIKTYTPSGSQLHVIGQALYDGPTLNIPFWKIIDTVLGNKIYNDDINTELTIYSIDNDQELHIAKTLIWKIFTSR